MNDDDDDVEILLDVASPVGSVAVEEAVALLSRLCAGLILVYFSATELYDEARRFLALRKVRP